uniref:beta strand repeat-containing protein n=1 Tax=Acidiphilium sp. TaxID=527 RepID=UPI002584B4F7
GINASLDATTLSLDASGGTIANAGSGSVSGYVTASTLDATASLVALTGSNSITTLGSINVGTLTLDDEAAALTIAGPFNVTDASLTDTGSLDIASAVSAIGSLGLSASDIGINASLDATILSLDAGSGTIANAGSGYVNATTLDAAASLVALTGSNAITTLGSINVGSFTLDDNAPLTIAGSFNATDASITDTGSLDIASAVSAIGSLGLSASDIGINASLDATTLSLDASGGTIANAGSGYVTASTLDATASLVALTGSNSITTLEDFVANSITLVDQSALTLAGTVSVATHGQVAFITRGLHDTSGATILAPDGTIEIAPLGSNQTAGILDLGGTSAGNVNVSTNFVTLLADSGAALLDLGTANAGTGTLAGGVIFDGNLPSFTPTLMVEASGSIVNRTILQAGTGTFSGGSIVNDGVLSVGNITVTGSDFSGSGAVTADSLAGSVSGFASLQNGGNSIKVITSLSAGSSIDVADSQPLTIAGTLSVASGGNIVLSANGMDLAGGTILANSGAVTLAPLGFDTIALGGTSTTALDLSNQLLNAISANSLQIGTVQTGLIENDGSISLSIPNILMDAGTININQPFLAQHSSLIVQAGGEFTGNGGITVAALGAAASLVALTGSNAITTLGSISAGNFTLDDNTHLTIAGSFNATNASLADTSGGGLDIAGQVSLASLLALSATSGSITSSGTGSISAPTLDAAASLVALTGSNVITTLGSINVGTFTLDDNAPLTIAGSLVAQRAAISAADLTIPGVILVDGALSLATSGTISETGTIDPTLLQIAGARDVLLTGSNTIDALGSVSVPLGNLALVDQVPLTVNGPVYALNISLDSPAMYIPGAINTPGTLGLGYGPISGNGPITAATLTSNSAVIGDVALTGTENVIGTLGGFDAAGHLFALTDATALTVAGPVSAKALTITATGQITLDGADGGSFSIGGQFLPTYVYNGLSPRNGIDSVLQVIANGAPANGIVQTGQFNIDTGPLQGQPNTLFMLLPDGADAKFNDLNARSTDLAISLINGYAQGTLYLHYLLVAGGLNGQTAFVGQIAGLAGSAAAHNGKVVPVPGSSYRFNSCIIGSVSCTVLPVAIVPERNPLDDFDISPRRRRKLDANVRLPGVAAKDY